MQVQERRSSRRQLGPRDKIGVDVADLGIGQVVQSILGDAGHQSELRSANAGPRAQ